MRVLYLSFCLEYIINIGVKNKALMIYLYTDNVKSKLAIYSTRYKCMECSQRIASSCPEQFCGGLYNYGASGKNLIQIFKLSPPKYSIVLVKNKHREERKKSLLTVTNSLYLQRLRAANAIHSDQLIEKN